MIDDVMRLRPATVVFHLSRKESLCTHTQYTQLVAGVGLAEHFPRSRASDVGQGVEYRMTPRTEKTCVVKEL